MNQLFWVLIYIKLFIISASSLANNTSEWPVGLEERLRKSKIFAEGNEEQKKNSQFFNEYVKSEYSKNKFNFGIYANHVNAMEIKAWHFNREIYNPTGSFDENKNFIINEKHKDDLISIDKKICPNVTPTNYIECYKKILFFAKNNSLLVPTFIFVFYSSFTFDSVTLASEHKITKVEALFNTNEIIFELIKLQKNTYSFHKNSPKPSNELEISDRKKMVVWQKDFERQFFSNIKALLRANLDALVKKNGELTAGQLSKLKTMLKKIEKKKTKSIR